MWSFNVIFPKFFKPKTETTNVITETPTPKSYAMQMAERIDPEGFRAADGIVHVANLPADIRDAVLVPQAAAAIFKITDSLEVLADQIDNDQIDISAIPRQPLAANDSSLQNIGEKGNSNVLSRSQAERSVAELYLHAVVDYIRKEGGSKDLVEELRIQAASFRHAVAVDLEELKSGMEAMAATPVISAIKATLASAGQECNFDKRLKEISTVIPDIYNDLAHDIDSGKANRENIHLTAKKLRDTNLFDVNPSLLNRLVYQTCPNKNEQTSFIRGMLKTAFNESGMAKHYDINFEDIDINVSDRLSAPKISFSLSRKTSFFGESDKGALDNFQTKLDAAFRDVLKLSDNDQSLSVTFQQSSGFLQSTRTAKFDISVQYDL